MMKIRKTAIALAVTAFMLPLTVQAAVPALDRVSVTLALAVPDSNTTINFDSNAGDEPVDFDKDLGLQSNNVVASFGGTWRPWDNHQFSLTYYNSSGDNTKSLTDPIEWNGVEYDGTVRLKTDMDSFDASYIWWVKNEDTWALGPRLGLNYIAFEAEIDLLIDADGDPVVDGSYKSDSNTDIPAPTIGAAWRWVPADDWRIHADVGYISATIGDFDGTATFLSGGVEWFPWDNWGFSMNVTRLDIDVDTDQIDFNGDVSLTQSNYSLGVTYRF